MKSRRALVLTCVLIALTLSFQAKTLGNGVASANASTSFVGWNLAEPEEPMLNLPDNARTNLELGLTLPFRQFGLPLDHALSYNAEGRKYLLMLVSDSGRRGNYFELRQLPGSRVYSNKGSLRIELVDQGYIKVLKAGDGNEYSFVSGGDGELQCVQIRGRRGEFVRLSYNSQGQLQSLNDNAERTIQIDYADDQVSALVQTWKVAAVKMVKRWSPQNHITHELTRTTNNYSALPKYGLVKSVPTNAVQPNYTSQMAECDRVLAAIFGGPGAVAAANGFEPAGLAGQYPIYRGDLRGSDGFLRPGHLSYALHLYGSIDGTASTPLYVPFGFTSHTDTPTPSDAAITFYYPTLGRLTNVTMAVFHVADFEIRNENGRIRIGSIGGRGGSYEQYRHSHIEFYRGNTGLPTSARRAALRINPSEVFSPSSDSIRMRLVAAR
jgi:YD repeat-containing protein